ncbi:MAG TPA: hypothetical protein VMF32_15930 [Xanthobacteraceae bacterium]|nr:hypothetical protein [Xanthobacteraceae bacterium]
MTDKRDILIDAIKRMLGDERALGDIAFHSAGESPHPFDFDEAYDTIERQLKALLATLNAAVPTKEDQTPEQRETLGYLFLLAREAGRPLKMAEAARLIAERLHIEPETVRQRLYRLPKELVSEFNRPGEPLSEVFKHLVEQNDG